MESVMVQRPSGPAMLVEILTQATGGMRLVAAWTTYSTPGVPAKVTVTVPFPLSLSPSVRGAWLAGETICTKALVRPAKFASPGYAAGMLFEPGGRNAG